MNLNHRACLLLLALAAACTSLDPAVGDGGGASVVDDASEASDSGATDDMDAADGIVSMDERINGDDSDGATSDGAVDAGSPGQEVDMLEACSEAGALRCAGSGRESCAAGRWALTVACQSGQVCSTQADSQGNCLDVAAVCRGGAGGWQCDAKGVLYQCSAEGVTVSAVDCSNARLCELGRASGKCATCVPGTYRCTDKVLERCNEAGSGFATAATCDTAALCNVNAGACTTSTCVAGRFNCQGNALRKCKTDQSGWDPLMTCGAGLCDDVAGECDVCVPGTKSCNMGSSVCNAMGQGYTNTACSGATSVCVGNGQCVQCDSDDDCPDPGVCRTRHCNLGTGACQPQLAAPRATCGAGLCSAQGDCVQCLSATSDCPAQTNPCRMATCSSGACGSANRTSGSCTLSGGASGVCSAGTCVECNVAGDCPSGRPYCILNQCRPCNGACAVGGACTRADDCSSGACTAGTCRPSCSGSCAIGASCSVDTDCGNGNQCVNNGCVDCASDGNCSSSAPYCTSNVCRQCKNSNTALCAAGQECVTSDCRTLVPSCQNDGNCTTVAPNSHCQNNLCLFSGQGSYPYTCPTLPSGWTYLGYVNLNDIYTYNAGLPMCLLTCPFSQCPRGYTCSSRTHTNPTNSEMSTVRVCWPDHLN